MKKQAKTPIGYSIVIDEATEAIVENVWHYSLCNFFFVHTDFTL